MALALKPGGRSCDNCIASGHLFVDERVTMRYLLPCLVLATTGSVASAALIPYYRMDSLAYLASDIVLCDEVHYVKKSKSSASGYEYYEATFTVVQTLKGSCRPKEKLTVELDLVYTRRLASSWCEEPDKTPAIGMGRALLFLTKTKEVWRPVIGGAKLLINGEAYCYGQFLSNPGPLWLARMAPENIEVPADKPFDEESLLKDLRAALEKAKGLTKAVSGYAHEGVIRREKQRK